MLRCPFKFLTGLDCPGCGIQRAIQHLLNFEIGDAIRENALLVFAIPYILLLIFLEVLGRNVAGSDLQSVPKKWHRLQIGASELRAILHSPKAIWIVVLIIIFWWVFRNF
jgi:hypothetical protein